MAGFLTALLHRGPRSSLSRYTEANGILYFVMGVALATVPVPLAGLLGIELVGGEPGYVRLMGLTLSVVGYFYWFGGRTGAESFGLSTLVDRFVLPFVLFPMAFAGLIDLEIALTFGILDPLLALGAWMIWRRECATG